MPFIELQSVDSTNNYALEQVHAGLTQHGQTIFAHEQSAGKGQRGRVWAAEKDANITMSVVVKPTPLQLAQQFQLSACTALALWEFFSRYAGEDTSIKWPNDLYWQDRKAGGVLIESVVRSQESGAGVTNRSEIASPSSVIARNMPVTASDKSVIASAAKQWEWSVIGIGININQTSFDGLPNPVSLKQITGLHFDTLALAKELCVILDKYFRQLISGDFTTIYHQYLSHLYKKNATVRLKKENRVFEAVIKSVSPTGQLVVLHAIEEEFNFGEIEWVR